MVVCRTPCLTIFLVYENFFSIVHQFQKQGYRDLYIVYTLLADKIIDICLQKSVSK